MRKHPTVTRTEIRRIRERVKKTAPESAKRVTDQIARGHAQSKKVDRSVIEILKQPVNYQPDY